MQVKLYANPILGLKQLSLSLKNKIKICDARLTLNKCEEVRLNSEVKWFDVTGFIA